MTKKIRKKRPHSITFTQPSLTRQSFADECDVNQIVERFTRTGHLPPARNPQYGDAPDQTFFEAACIQAEMRSQMADQALESRESDSEAPEAEKGVEDDPKPAPPESAPESASEAAEDERSG